MLKKTMAAASSAAVLATPALALADERNDVRDGEANHRIVLNDRDALRLIGHDLDPRGERPTISFKRTSRGLTATSSTKRADPVATAACPVCVIVITTAARVAAAGGPGAAAAPAVVSRVARTAAHSIVVGSGRNFPRLKWPARQVQAKFSKHASDFGVHRAWGAGAAREFEEAIKRHMLDPTTWRMLGSIKGKGGENVHAVHFYNPLTKRVASFKPNGEFITAYTVQLEKHQTRIAAFGHLGKVGRWTPQS